MTDFKPMLLHSWDFKKDVTGWLFSEKFDGIRTYWDGTKLWTRSGIEIHAHKSFTDKLPPIPMDGELSMRKGLSRCGEWTHYRDFNKASGIIRRHNGSEEDWSQIMFYVFDLPSHGDEPFVDRTTRLYELSATTTPSYRNGNKKVWRPVQQYHIKSNDHLKSRLDEFLECGSEGLVIRHPDSKYEEDTRSRDVLKVKKVRSLECKVVGYTEGQGKHKGRVGALKCKPLGDNPDVEFCIGTGMSDEDRENPPAIGSTITFEFDSFSAAGIPRFPVFKGERIDA